MRKNKIGALLLAGAILVTGAWYGPALQADEDQDQYATEEEMSSLASLAERDRELAAQQESVNQEMAQVQSEVDNLTTQSNGLNSQLDALRAEGKILDSEYETLMGQLKAAEETMRAAIQAYEDAKADVEVKQEEFQKRLVAMYKRSQQSFLEVLLNSNGITGFFTNLKLLETIGKTDAKVLDDLTQARAKADFQKNMAKQTKDEYEQFVSLKQEEINNLAKGIRSTEDELASVMGNLMNRSSYLGDLNADYNSLDSERASIKAQQSQINQDIANRAEAAKKAAEEARKAEAAKKAAEEARKAEAAKKAAEEARKKEEAQKPQPPISDGNAGGGQDSVTKPEVPETPEIPETPQVPSTSGFIHPSPGNYDISYYFGWRPHPVYGPGVMNFHSGIDLTGGFNDPIVAAADGVVVTAYYPYPNMNWGGWSYGNYVEILHDDGTKTLYGHLKSIDVVKGQRVSQGERIGGMGSTGMSTGCHLHFEVQIPNGGSYTQVDPLGYLP
jgi:murein DD-endopeptidase MepM/ murein hydrolase activator NlpD